MGACLGHCFARFTDLLSRRPYYRHTGMSSQGDERVELNQEIDDGNSEQHESKKLLSFLFLKRFQKKHRIPVTLELIEEVGWPGNSNKYTKLNSKFNASTSSSLDSPLRVLDARSLLKQQGCVSYTPASSLDLEWEHEGMQLSNSPEEIMDISPNISPSATSEDDSPACSLTVSPWSRVSTPNSLEWDPVEADMACIDVETENLLTEIERLTDKALKETGEWTGTS